MARRTLNRLTHVFVQKVKEPGRYADGGGLYLQVTPGAEASYVTKSWLFQYTLNGRERRMGLGSLTLHGIELPKAREKAAECRKQIADGIDPIAARDVRVAQQRLEDAKAITFDQCSDLYISAHKAGWRNAKHAQQWKNTLTTYASPVFGSLPVASIDLHLVLKVLEPIWNTKNETASRVRGRIESILDWAKTRGYRQGENPARWKGNLDTQLAARGKVHKVKHHAALPYAELPAFILELRTRPEISARALELVILSGGRSNEIIGAQWTEFDFKSRTWSIPANRMKGEREHVVPLTDAALGVLEQAIEFHRSNYVFPGERGPYISNMAMLMLLRRMGYGGKITVHGFRSTFRDWVGNCTDFAGEVAEGGISAR
jgi:integrase